MGLPHLRCYKRGPFPNKRAVYICIYCICVCAHVCGSSPFSSAAHTAKYCDTLLLAATHCNSLQQMRMSVGIAPMGLPILQVLQHTAAHCNTLQHTATNCNTLQHTATHCNTLQHAATRCSTLQQMWLSVGIMPMDLPHFQVLCLLQHTATRCNALQCNTLQHNATHCNTL